MTLTLLYFIYIFNNGPCYIIYVSDADIRSTIYLYLYFKTKETEMKAKTPPPPYGGSCQFRKSTKKEKKKVKYSYDLYSRVLRRNKSPPSISSYSFGYVTQCCVEGKLPLYNYYYTISRKKLQELFTFFYKFTLILKKSKIKLDICSYV